MKYTIIQIVHGVQAFSLNKETVREFILKIRKNLPEKVKDYCVFRCFDWDDIVGQRQLEAFEMEKGLPRQKLLKAKHTLGSDILWDCQTKNSETKDSIYSKITDKFQNEVSETMRTYGEDSNLVLLGHSWGGQRSLSFCFDSKYPVSGLITMGAPITAVSGRFSDWGRLPEGLKFWLNFRMKYDFIGSQFKYHKNESIRKFVEDVHLSSWNPRTWFAIGAHVNYWENDEVAERIAKKILKNFY